MKTLITLILLLITITINLVAQTPPMPPIVTFGTNISIGQVTNITIKAWHKPVTFTANCPHCGGKFKGLKPDQILTNGGMVTNGGTIQFRTITFTCPNLSCQESFSSQNTKFVPASVATEDIPDSASATQIKNLDVVTWTTDPNLKLSIQLTNWINTAAQPTSGIITSSNHFDVPASGVTNTIETICGPAVIIKYPTIVGKSYKCQASDDAKQTWIDGPVVAGTGMPVIQYEAANHTNRIYRVVEL